MLICKRKRSHYVSASFVTVNDAPFKKSIHKKVRIGYKNATMSERDYLLIKRAKVAICSMLYFSICGRMCFDVEKYSIDFAPIGRYNFR